jgi:Do/DeqQ family serine protease
MKGKYLIGGFLMAFLGAAIALFAYTKITGRTSAAVSKDSAGVKIQDARPYLTAMQMQEGQIDFTFAAEQTVHAVVHVRTKSIVSGQADNPVMEWFYGDRYSRPREVSGYGSGVIISGDGYIITNNHVIDNAESIEVKLNDNRTFTAQLIGRDPASDIALLKVKAENLPVIKYGDSEKLRLGEWVLAVGNPFNLTSTVTAGIVSAKGRSFTPPDGTYRLESFIQTDAALNMGNSGGALVDTKGLLVGITSAIISPNGAYAGNSFAIPVTVVKKVVNDLKEFGQVQRALIGVRIKDVESEDAEELKLDEVRGIRITEVSEGGSAEDAKLKAKDVIVKFDGVSVNTVSELQEQVGKHRPGDKATITYIRSGEESTVPIVLKNASGTTGVVTAEIVPELIYGARLEAVKEADMNKYKIDYGVKVKELSDGKFKDIGIPKGYIILDINGKKVKNPSDVTLYTNNEKSLKSMGGIQPDGTRLNYQFGN